jgi:hypothetical protein
MAASGPMGILRETFDKFSQMKKPVWSEFGMDAPPVKRPGEMAGYAVGRVAADYVSDATRERIWRLNALQAQTTDLGRTVGAKMGLSKRDAMLAGVGLTNVVELSSGNIDIRNLDEAGRPAGYRSIFPVETPGIDHVTGEQIVIKDFLKSQNPVAEVAARYLLGRTGSVLPWEQFKLERPEVTPEDYARVMKQYRDKTLFGVEKQDAKVTGAIGTLAGAGIAALTKKPQHLVGGAVGGFMAPSTANVVSELGVLQGTRESFDDPVGEVRVFGYRLPIAKVAGATALTLGLGVGAKKLYDADILNLNKIKEFGQDRFTKKWNRTEPQGNLWGPEGEDGFPIGGQR